MEKDARSVVMELFASFGRGQIDQIEVEDDIVSVLITRTETDPTTGTVFRRQALEMFRVEGGRIVERWGFHDEPPSADALAQRPAKIAST
jgi:ketosteroid isomerase-like protein